MQHVLLKVDLWELKNFCGIVFSWPSLQARRDYLKCVLVYKSLDGLSPAYLLTEFKHAHQFHTYNTRHRDLLRLPLAKATKGSFRYNGACTFNTLPLSIRNISEFQTFKIRAKRYFKSLDKQL